MFCPSRGHELGGSIFAGTGCGCDKILEQLVSHWKSSWCMKEIEVKTRPNKMNSEKQELAFWK